MKKNIDMKITKIKKLKIESMKSSKQKKLILNLKITQSRAKVELLKLELLDLKTKLL